MAKIIFLLFLISNFLINYCHSTNYPTINSQKLKNLFDSVKPYTDLSTAYYSVKGLQQLGETIANQPELCTFVKSKLDVNSLESVFFANGISSAISNCPLTLKDFQQTITNAAASQNVVDLYYYSQLATQHKLPLDLAKLSKSLLEALKKDNSVLNQGYSLHIAALLNQDDKTYFNNIEDILEQADEIDGKYLQYEGGVVTTSIVLEGIFKLAEKFKQLTPKLSADRLNKFTNYLTSKRYVNNVKSGYHLLSIANKLADNQFSIPVIVNRISSISLTEDSPNVLISVLNIIGKPVKQATFNVETESAKHHKDTTKQLFTVKKQFQSKSSDGTTYELNLVDIVKTQPDAGFYVLTLAVTPKSAADKRFFVLNNQVEVKFFNKFEIVDLQIGAADRDSSSPKLTKIEGGKKLSTQLSADQTSKIYIKFNLKEKSKGKFIEAHQTFVRFVDKSGREIFFIAEANPTTKQYTCDVDLTTNAKNFNNLNGVYTIELIVSDDLLSTQEHTQIADIKISFSDASVEGRDTLKRYAPKPEIKHLFRQPDPTPSKLVSSVFSVLTLLPVLVLVILWFNIGFNVSKFQFSLSGLVFHVSLAAVFGLIYCYWAYLNMFDTLKYLAIISVVLFWSGKNLLSRLATKKEKKTN